jgi:hypothetical protein
MRLLLGSCSKIKKRAVTLAFGDLLDEEIICYPSLSRVPEQPIGQEQTREGAFNRALDAREHCGRNFDYVIGIENGIWESSGQWVDGACVCILPHAWEGDFAAALSSVDFLWSDVLIIPPVNERPFKTGPNGEWSVLKDPHAVLTGGARPRAEFLRHALSPFVDALRSEKVTSSSRG